MKNFKSPKNAKGFSLLELMLVLAAIVVLGAIVFNQYNKFRQGQQASEEAQNLAAAATGVKGLYTRGDYSTLSTTVARNGKFFPDTMNVGGTITNSWDGAVGIGPVLTSAATSATGQTAIADGAATAPAAGSANRFFGISYANVPSEVCIKLAGAAGATFGKISIAGTQVKNTLPGATQAFLNEAEVAAQCGDGTAVTMAFVSN